ncbi:MAG: hypothetical protein AAFQ98_16325, partial [Bacteroidota bacterium]
MKFLKKYTWQEGSPTLRNRIKALSNHVAYFGTLEGESVITWMDLAGNALWTKRLAYAEGITLQDMVETPDGGAIAVASFLRAGSQLGAYLKWDAQGEVEWMREVPAATAAGTPSPLCYLVSDGSSYFLFFNHLKYILKIDGDGAPETFLEFTGWEFVDVNFRQDRLVLLAARGVFGAVTEATTHAVFVFDRDLELVDSKGISLPLSGIQNAADLTQPPTSIFHAPANTYGESKAAVYITEDMGAYRFASGISNPGLSLYGEIPEYLNAGDTVSLTLSTNTRAQRRKFGETFLMESLPGDMGITSLSFEEREETIYLINGTSVADNPLSLLQIDDFSDTHFYARMGDHIGTIPLSRDFTDSCYEAISVTQQGLEPQVVTATITQIAAHTTVLSGEFPSVSPDSYMDWNLTVEEACVASNPDPNDPLNPGGDALPSTAFLKKYVWQPGETYTELQSQVLDTLILFWARVNGVDMVLTAIELDGTPRWTQRISYAEGLKPGSFMAVSTISTPFTRAQNRIRVSNTW